MGCFIKLRDGLVFGLIDGRRAGRLMGASERSFLVDLLNGTVAD